MGTLDSGRLCIAYYNKGYQGLFSFKDYSSSPSLHTAYILQLLVVDIFAALAALYEKGVRDRSRLLVDYSINKGKSQLDPAKSLTKRASKAIANAKI